MGPKIIIILALLYLATLTEEKPTFGLLNKIKNSVSESRCKLHKIGSKILEHGHAHGDPCGEAEPSFTTTYIIEPSIPSTTTELFPKNLDIDVRSSLPENTIRKSLTPTAKNADGFASVPSGGGRNIGRVKCNQGQVETADGCMDEA